MRSSLLVISHGHKIIPNRTHMCQQRKRRRLKVLCLLCEIRNANPRFYYYASNDCYKSLDGCVPSTDCHTKLPVINHITVFRI